MFKGPQFYSEEEHSIFKGRERETNDLLYLVEHSDFCVCYAVSGEGKSSLINAGLCPKLREDSFLPIHIKNITEAEVGHFDEFVWNKVKDTINSERKKERYSELSMLKMEPKPENKALYNSIWWKLRTREFRINSYETVTPVLIFDQFEEVFSSAKDLSWTDALFSWLESLYQDEKPLSNEYNGRLQKKFKALFSLRSEYVCELDYWSMNKYFIPSLKNNRFYLKPMTKGSALEVASQLDRLPDTLKTDDVIKYAKTERIGEWENVKEELPCVSALILSLILTGLSENNADVESKIKHINESYDVDKGKELFDFLLDNVYKKALQECNATNKDVIKNYIETLEDTLIDIHGRRRHVSERELPPITNDVIREALATLEKERIINVIDHHYEISHDSLCRIILKRKEERQKIKESEMLMIKEKAQKLKGQREDAVSGIFLLLFFLFVSWLLSSVFCNKSTFMSLLDLNGDRIVTYYYEQLLFYFILGNLVVLPLLIYSMVKKLRITAWLSLYCLLSNVVLLYFFTISQHEQMEIRTTLGLVTLGVPFVTLLYSYIFHSIGFPRKEEFFAFLNSVPLIIFFLAVSIYIFYLCLFNSAIGLPTPSNSSWGIVVIPLLTHELIKLVQKQKEQILPFVLLIISLLLLAYNTIGGSSLFPSFVVISLLLCAIVASIGQYRELTLLKCAFSSILQSLVIMVIVILNLGYNPVKIDYSSVSHVYSWKEITIKNRIGKIGIVEACCGDTLVPCVFDSINSERIMYLSTNKMHYESDKQDYNGHYSYRKETGVAQYQCLYVPSREQYIYKMANKEIEDSNLSDSISYHAAKAYFELRNANISFLLSGYSLSLGSFSSLGNLYKCELKELDRCLDQMKINGTINGQTVSDFNRSFARTFYLCLLKDRIVKKDSINVFSLSQEILPLFFYDSSSDFEITTISFFNINFGDFHKSYLTRIKLSDMREGGNDNKIEAWYNYIEIFALLDMSLNAAAYSSSMEKQIMSIIGETQEKIREIDEKIKKQKQNLSKLNSLTNNEHLSPDQLKETISLTSQAINEWQSTQSRLEEAKQFVSNKLSDLDEERIQIDMDFRQLINKAFQVLPHIVTETQNIYNANFSNICELLYMVAAIRLYDMSSVYLQELEHMDGAKMKTYIEFKKTQEEKNKMIQKIRNMSNQLKK